MRKNKEKEPIVYTWHIDGWYDEQGIKEPEYEDNIRDNSKEKE